MIQLSESMMSWASIIGDVTLEQAKTNATMPFIFPHLASMPDAIVQVRPGRQKSGRTENVDRGPYLCPQDTTTPRFDRRLSPRSRSWSRWPAMGLRRSTATEKSWHRQLGSLGSGNHFLEVTADEADGIWLFLHAGSRGVGNRIAAHHISVAQELAKRWWIELPDPDLAYLIEGTPQLDSYIVELNWAQRLTWRGQEVGWRRRCWIVVS